MHRDQAVDLDYTRRETCAGDKGVLEFHISKKRFWPSLLLEEVPHVKLMTKKQSNSESCSELHVTATSLFLRGKTLPEEEACF